MSEGIAEHDTRTGVDDIDEAIAAVDSLDPDDVASHVAVFERVHETLRGRLDTASDRS